jgi:formylglycine-generating enzyme required for sulfatase activity
MPFPVPLPDDPKKWDGWAKYKSSNLYERLCLDPRANPSNELIEEHCRELLRWWQKKLPLKNQPSNPLSQMLRPGLEESSRYLTEARVELLDPNRRRVMDNELAAQALEESVAEFHKYLTFAIADGKLTVDEEKNLIHFGTQHGLTEAQMLGYIENELKDSGATRVAPPPPAAATNGAASPRVRRGRSLDPKEDFMRMLRLSNLDSDTITDDQRDAFINMAENLGLEAGDAEDIVDLYLEEADKAANSDIVVPVVTSAPRLEVKERPVAAAVEGVPEVAPINIDDKAERAQFINFQNSLGQQMLLVPSAEFAMGSDAVEAAPSERPVSRVTLSRYYLSRHLITNADYEQFDPSHARKRAPGTGDRHPVVYVSSLEAIKFCQWLSTRERKKYRLPTEAEWEYAARGKDGRQFPWGNHTGRGDLANFADKNTVFAWSDRDIDDGYPESSPVGAFPRGASPFGMDDMAGNVWEWCLDYFEPYRTVPRINPRGPTVGAKRVYRGGSWKSRFSSLRTTARGSNIPSYSCNDLGFRVACECD